MDGDQSYSIKEECDDSFQTTFYASCEVRVTNQRMVLLIIEANP